MSSNPELERAITEIVALLQGGRFPNEQAISQGIVLRILQCLGWNQWDTSIVWPEFQTGEGRVDFALCHPARKPCVFIEVKQPGRAEEGVRQALEYAFHTGVPLIVLTDGQTWSLYLPAERGSYEDRRVHKLDLYERSTAEAAEVLVSYLDHGRTISGVAFEEARGAYRSKNRRSEASEAIGSAWLDLVGRGDELLVEILTDAVESRVGIRPDSDDVAAFLERLVPGPTGVIGASAPTAVSEARNRPGPPSSGESQRAGELHLLGEVRKYQNAKEAMLLVLKTLAQRDPTLMERCAAHPNMSGRKRRYIARTASELYPDREDLREMCEKLPGGWLVATNLNNVLKRSIISTAANLAGLTMGKDIRVEF